MFLLSSEHVLNMRELVVHNNATPPLHNPSSSQVSTMSQMDRYTRLVGVERTIQQICLCNSTITSATSTPCDVMTVRTRWAEDWSGIEPRTSRPNAKRSGLVHSLLHPLARSLPDLATRQGHRRHATSHNHTFVSVKSLFIAYRAVSLSGLRYILSQENYLAVSITADNNCADGDWKGKGYASRNIYKGTFSYIQCHLHLICYLHNYGTLGESRSIQKDLID